MRVLAQNGAWCKDSKALRYRDCAGIDRIVHGGRMVRYHDCAGIGRCMAFGAGSGMVRGTLWVVSLGAVCQSSVKWLRWSSWGDVGRYIHSAPRKLMGSTCAGGRHTPDRSPSMPSTRGEPAQWTQHRLANGRMVGYEQRRRAKAQNSPGR